MKKLSLTLALTLLISSVLSPLTASAAFSEESSSSIVNEDSTADIISEVEMQSVLGIPVFFTYVTEECELESVRNDVANLLSPLTQDSVSASLNSNVLFTVSSNYATVQLSANQVSDTLDDPRYLLTYERVANLVANGVAVNYINFYIKTESVENNDNTYSVSNADDPEAWADYFTFYNYSGYKFLYSESEISVTTPWVEPDNLSVSFNWGNLLQCIVESVITAKLESASKVMSGAYGAFSSILGSITTPLSITYGVASEGELLNRVKGIVYTRTIFIEDKNDRVSGYLYYPWGTVEQAQLQLGVSATFPVSQRTVTTYNYSNKIGYGNTKIIQTDGFLGNATVCKKILNYYNNTAGYFTYNESLDLDSIIYTLIVE